ncbi:hypothetical protein ANME2D_02365 [Candidatus Methanoperedens nitroreducens]|uniref:Uncharacterized protein n=1 Tax=Candidatus Methanoperedens nitratireducens TaxID=1392998 RepID=A0A062V8C1_9EURY|nr:hypothetical protein [Candidatus Methanoperedens nitroreducens]KCZ71630.1 hypothetical protein ANME2D_02365 [Candidatus Methanoperedens nitroreducens]MDJ1421259.1 hypothetical protein [Candidatus Methanoperedens sp.]
MAQKNRKTQVKSVSLDVLTIRRMNHVLESHFANQLGASDLISHAINDFCNKIEFAEQSGVEIPVPQGRWG